MDRTQQLNTLIETGQLNPDDISVGEFFMKQLENEEISVYEYMEICKKYDWSLF